MVIAHFERPPSVSIISWSLVNVKGCDTESTNNLLGKPLLAAIVLLYNILITTTTGDGMAEKIDTPPRRRTRYPWHEWTDGSTWRIKQGEDYDISDLQMQGSLHMRARNNNLTVQTASPEAGVIEFQFKRSGDDVAN
jgi:hypothetical protein